MDDGKWCKYITERIPINPRDSEGADIHRRIQRLLPYAWNLGAEDRNRVNRHIIELTQAAIQSDSMGKNWKEVFFRKAAQARRRITR